MYMKLERQHRVSKAEFIQTVRSSRAQAHLALSLSTSTFAATLNHS